MVLSRRMLGVAGVVLVVGMGWSGAGAQTAYTVTQASGMMGQNVESTVYRDGTKVLVDSVHGPSADSPKGTHVRTFFDLASHKSFTWDLMAPGSECGVGGFSGNWGDPFADSASMKADVLKGAKETGTETINGFTATVYEASSSDGKVKAWVDVKSGMLLKAQMTPAGEATMVIVEVKKMSMVAPAAGVFELPATCKAAAATPAPLTPEQQIAAETGGTGEYVNAEVAPAGKASGTCSVVLRVVAAKTMTPIVSGYQLAVDASDDAMHAKQYMRTDVAGGRETFAGGGLHEVTGQNGVVRIENAPAYFNVLTHWQSGGWDSQGAIYRQCFGAQTVLLYVVKDPSDLGKGGDWLWAKSGKFAGR